MKTTKQSGAPAVMVQRVASRKSLVHGIASCRNCGWECTNYLTVQRSARRHTKKTGHNVAMELGYHVTIAASDSKTL